MAPTAHDIETARALWLAAPGRAEILEEELPELREGDVRVRARWGAVSRGTEALVFLGRVPASEHARMRAPFQEGEFPAPVKYGYSNVGIVEAGPSGLVGRGVFCLYPHQTRYVIPATAATALPDGLPAERAVLAANMETALTVVWDALPHAGDRIAVVGGGVVGGLCAWLCGRIAGCAVTLVDIDPGRAAVAEALGIAFATPAEAPDEVDLAIHASGDPAGLATALALAGTEAVIVEASWYGDRIAPLALGEAFHAKRLTIRSSQVGSIPPAQRPRWTHARRVALALDLLQAPELDVLFTGESRFDDLPATLARLATTPEGALCHRIRYPEP